MNGTNKILYRIMVGVVSAYILLSLSMSLWEIYSTDSGLEIRIFSLINAAAALLLGGQALSPDIFFIDPSAILGNAWSGYCDLLNSIYVKPFSGYLNEKIHWVALLIIASSLVSSGIKSETWCNFKGTDDDPRKFLLTHRKNAFIWALEFPWNIFYACWKFHYVPVILPILFLPAMLPFLVPCTVVSLIWFVLLRAFTDASIRSASKKDNAAYESETGYGICPECMSVFDYPRAKCQICKLEFNYPRPDGHGVKTQYCNNGHPIPCRNDHAERAALTAVCPNCGAHIKTREARPRVFSLVGAGNSGKTSLVLSAASYVYGKAKVRGIVVENGFGTDKTDLEMLDSPEPTPVGRVPFRTLFIRRSDFGERELVFADISGQEFEPQEFRDLFQEYYRHCDGIVFVIDPTAVSDVHLSKSLTKGSKTTPKSTFDTFFQIFSLVNGVGPSTLSDTPFAVVLTKSGFRNASKLLSGRTPEEFLRENGQGEFVDTLSSLFTNVKYFVADSKEDTASAAAPFAWILQKTDPKVYSALEGGMAVPPQEPLYGSSHKKGGKHRRKTI